MRKILFSICAALAVLGCSGLLPGDDGDLLGGGNNDDRYIYGSCTDYYSDYCYDDVSQYDCESYIGGYFVRGGMCDGGYSGNPSEGSYSDNNINNYRTVQIGGQRWMAENLNYYISDSKCYGNNASNCEKYGRLYDWATAMAFESSCNYNSCSSMIKAKHQGICPTGWHLPTNAEWDALFRYADGTSGTSSPYDSPTAGRYLKATDGWYNNGNGEDTYGFAALPGGLGFSDGDFLNAGDYGYWWSASERNDNYAYRRYMLYNYEYALWDYYDKTTLRSVRCVQD